MQHPIYSMSMSKHLSPNSSNASVLLISSVVMKSVNIVTQFFTHFITTYEPRRTDTLNHCDSALYSLHHYRRTEENWYIEPLWLSSLLTSSLQTNRRELIHWTIVTQLFTHFITTDEPSDEVKNQPSHNGLNVSVVLRLSVVMQWRKKLSHNGTIVSARFSSSLVMKWRKKAESQWLKCVSCALFICSN
jgi:hypothetical protein